MSTLKNLLRGEAKNPHRRSISNDFKWQFEITTILSFFHSFILSFPRPVGQLYSTGSSHCSKLVSKEVRTWTTSGLPWRPRCRSCPESGSMPAPRFSTARQPSRRQSETEPYFAAIPKEERFAVRYLISDMNNDYLSYVGK